MESTIMMLSLLNSGASTIDFCGCTFLAWNTQSADSVYPSLTQGVPKLYPRSSQVLPKSKQAPRAWQPLAKCMGKAGEGWEKSLADDKAVQAGFGWQF